MPRYQVDIRTPKIKQTFVTEDLDIEVAKVRLKSFVDATASLMDYIVDIKPLPASTERRERFKLKEQQCLYETGRICPLGEDQTVEDCLHCDGRGL